jgi:hypothetical protein
MDKNIEEKKQAENIYTYSLIVSFKGNWNDAE